MAKKVYNKYLELLQEKATCHLHCTYTSPISSSGSLPVLIDIEKFELQTHKRENRQKITFPAPMNANTHSIILWFGLVHCKKNDSAECLINGKRP